MNVLVFNVGSASLKFQVIATAPDTGIPEQGRAVVSGAIEEFGAEATLSSFENKEIAHQEKVAAADYGEAARQALSWLNAAKRPGLPAIGQLDAVGHRVVHGGDRFSTPVRIDNEVIMGIEELEDLAPLHNAPAVSVIRASQEALGSDLPMVAVFDTEFHRSIPPQAYTYALPWELAGRHRIRRYGFHGVAHEYLAGRYARIAGRPVEKAHLITLHLESGCSACAVRGGQSVDTSMGFTPLEGLMMGMRSGDIDPSIIGYLMRQERVGIEQVEKWLNKESGLLGVSGRSHDTRELMKLIAADERVQLAMEVFCYRIHKYIGAYLAVLGGAEAVIFGGGIGENTPFVRRRACEGFEWCGLQIDPALNERTIDCEGRITTDDSRLHAYVIPAEEELMIAQKVVQCLGGTAPRAVAGG
jgi:acetate kinase